MMDEFNRKNLHRTCRLCLEPVSESCTLLPIYENVNLSGRHFNGYDESIPEIISCCVGIEVEPCDGLPMAICSSCEKSLISSHSFRLKCLKANQWLSQFKLKAEDAIEDDAESEDDTTGHSTTEAEGFVVKEEPSEEIPDHESESISSMYDSVLNSIQRQRTSMSSCLELSQHF